MVLRMISISKRLKNPNELSVNPKEVAVGVNLELCDLSVPPRCSTRTPAKNLIRWQVKQNF